MGKYVVLYMSHVLMPTNNYTDYIRDSDCNISYPENKGRDHVISSVQFKKCIINAKYS